MKLKGGLRNDERFIDIPDGSWVDARNILLQKGFQSISNENGNVLLKTITGYNICGIIPTYDSFVICSTDNINTSEIAIYKNGIYQVIINDNVGLFKFNINNPIEGVFKFNYKGDIIVAFADGINNSSQTPKILNLNDLPFQVDGSFHLINPNDINLAKIFPNVRVPEIIINEVNNNGGALKAGDYYLAIAYEIENNDLTNYLSPSKPIAIATLVETIGSNPYIYNDTLPGNTTSVSINITINNLDLSFKFFRLVSISKLTGIVTAQEVGRFPTNSDFDINGNGKYTYTYTGEENITVIDLKSVFVNNATFSKAKAITNFENRLYFGNTKINGILDYQKYANNIKIKYGTSLAPIGSALETFSKLKDYTQYISFMPEEVYGINIHLILLDGTVTKGYHIKGRESRSYNPRLGNRLNYTYFGTSGGNTILLTTGWICEDVSSYGTFSNCIIKIGTTNYTGSFAATTSTDGGLIINGIISIPPSGVVDIYLVVGNEDDLISSITAYTPTDESLIDVNLKIFQVHDTSDEVSITNNGLMGFWENENETYPDTNDFDIWGIDSGVYQNLTILNPILYPTLRNTKVKHHKMPNQNNLLNNTYNQVPNIIGIQPYDIIIPPEIENLIQGFYFSFIKRDFNNRTIIGNDLIIENPVDATYGNTYDFALLTDKPSINPTYVKEIYSSINPSFVINSLPALEGTLNHTKRIKFTEYHPDNNSATIPSNASRAENVSFKYMDGLSFAYDGSPSSSTIYSVNLCNYLKNIYLAFNTQQDLCSTGKIIYTNGSGSYNLIGNTIYGGDTFVNLIYTNIDTYGKRYYVYSSFNIAYREKDLASWSSYSYNHYQYNKDYSSLLDIKQPSAFNPFTPEINNFPFRINRSNISAEESISIGWRTFLSDSYFEMTKDKGEIWSLAHLNKELLVQMKYSLFSAKVRDRLATSGVETFLGVSDVFDREPDEIVATPFGYIGSQSQWASFVCKIGYVVCDKLQGKVFIYRGSGQEPIEISNIGLRNFFMINLITDNIDNPFASEGLTASYDEKNERIILTRLHLNQNELEGLTISFSVNDKVWICKHDYYPNYIFNTREGLYFILNSNNNSEIYQHNIGNNGNFQNSIYESYIDVIFKSPSQVSKIFDNVNWKSEIINSNKVNLKDKTITHIMLYNSTQCSDKISLNTKDGSWFTPNCVNDQETWKFNNFSDVVKDKTLPFLDSKNQIISLNINNNKNWFDKSLFIDKFVIVRFIYDNIINNDIYLSDVNIEARQSNE